MKNILVAIDGSEQSRRAVGFAVDLARRLSAHLTIAHVVPTYDFDAEHVSFKEFGRAHEAYAQEMLEEARRNLDLPASQVHTRILRGSPAEAAAKAAEDEDASLVVVGSRGLSAMGRMVLGSVSDRLVHICSKPVLVVH